MFSGLYRKSSNNISSLITNLKELFKPNSIDAIPSLYFSNKIEEQRTLHLKVIKMQTENNSIILKNLYSSNPMYKLMIKDLLKDFKSFNITEICDFLTWYRRSLSIGCLGSVSDSDFHSISAVIKDVVVDPSDFFPFKTTFYFNCGTFNLKNDYILKSLSQNTYNMKMSDIKQLLFIMNLNPEFNDPGLLEFILSKLDTAFNRLSSLSDYFYTYENYIINCELNKRVPDLKVTKKFENLFDSTFRLSPWKLAEIVNNEELPRLKQLNSKFNATFKDYSSKHLKDPKICFEYARFVSTVHSQDTHMIKDAYDQIKYYLIQNKFDLVNIKTKLLIDMTKSMYKDLVLADLLVEQELDPIENKTSFLLNFVYYHEITGKSLLEKLNLKGFNIQDAEKICKELDLIYMNRILITFIRTPCKSNFKELVQNWIVDEIINRSKKDLQVAKYYYLVCKFTGKIWPSEIYRRLIVDINLCIQDSELKSRNVETK